MTNSMNVDKYYVGVDLGGTKILCGVFTSELEFIGKAKKTTKPERGYTVVKERIVRCIREAVDECDLELKHIRAIGIGSPGSIDEDKGSVIFAANLNWTNAPLREDIQKRMKIPVFVENDCTVCTLGIYERELKCEPVSMVGIYLGTGIGGGLIIDRKVFSGFNNTAGEIGHMIIDVGGPRCTCGNKGCFEALASRTAIYNKLREAMNAGQETVLEELTSADLKKMKSGDLKKAIKQGDRLVETVVAEVAEYTGIAVANVINLLNPEAVVLGGGLIEALSESMMEIIEKTAREYAFSGAGKGVKILPSRLGDNAGIVGAAVFARNRAG
ncbi:MAG: ROK family protein [Verrucomicrobia bacterium]|nr:ROK family protein [Verrucomicrobiota bacterium]